MERFTGILGILTILGVSYLLSKSRRQVNFRLVGWGLGLQFIFAVFILKTPVGTPIFFFFGRAIQKLLSFSDEGAQFVFNNLAIGPGSPDSLGLFFAFQVLPTIIFFSAFMAILYHFGLMQVLVRLLAKVMQRTMKTSGSETLSASANIFVGPTEAPLVIRPFIETMTLSEIMAIMTVGFATIAGGVMAIYVKMLHNVPNIAGHLMAASVMSAPAALVIAKIMHPETEDSPTKGDLKMEVEKTEDNVVEAITRGSTDGMRLAVNVATLLIAIIALVAAVNYFLGMMGLSLEQILGWIFSPLSFIMGVPLKDIFTIGRLMGEKIVLTELIAYGHLQELVAQLEMKSVIIASYALCGFANFASIGIQVGGIGALAPNRRKDLSKLAVRAMIGGAFASWLTASIVGIIL
jgi:CNT family concentrative nucleoside transporter